MHDFDDAYTGYPGIHIHSDPYAKKKNCQNTTTNK